MKRRNRFPKGWDEDRVQEILEHYERQTEEEALAEDEAAFRRRDQTVMLVPKGLVPIITKLITREETVAARTRHKKALDQSAG
jgi:hypothetical protein